MRHLGLDQCPLHRCHARKLSARTPPAVQLSLSKHVPAFQASADLGHVGADCSVRITHIAALPKGFEGGTSSGSPSGRQQPGQGSQAPSSHSFEEHEDSVYGALALVTAAC